MTEFYDAIRNKATTKKYEGRLKQFFDFLKIEGDLKQQARLFTIQAEKDPRWATSVINDWIRFHKERANTHAIQESTIKNFYKPIKLFCEQNDIILNWKKIARRIPKGRDAADDRAPRKDELKTLLGYDDRRIKPIVLSMVSGGFRPGSWDYLRWRDFELMRLELSGPYVACKVTIYRAEPEEYYTFITMEAYNAVKDWMDFRASHGEKIDGSSWIMVRLWDTAEENGAALTRKLKSTGVKRLIERALIGQRIRTQKVKNQNQAGKHRHEFQAEAGLRKYFKTSCERVMKTLNVEMLMGHDTGLNKNYNRPPPIDLLKDYLKAVPELTILESIPQVSEDVEELKVKNLSLEDRVAQLEKSLTKQNELIANLTPYIDKYMREEMDREEEEFKASVPKLSFIPLVCQKCNRSDFSTPKELQDHLKTHGHLKEYKAGPFKKPPNP